MNKKKWKNEKFQIVDDKHRGSSEVRTEIYIQII